jgi:dihydroxy-acid dehydratase
MSPTERPRSREVTDGPERAPARAMLRAVGFSEDDFGKPQVGVASSWNEVTPCNYHLDKLAALAKEGVRQGNGVPLEFTTIAVSDGIAMGHEGMKASLVSRDVIADSVELVMHAERMDALVGIAGCDKSEPGMLMAMARLNLPSVYLYGGTILPGTYRGRDITIQDVFEAVGAHAKGTMTDDELLGSSEQRVPRRARAPACTPRTRWPPRRRRSACRSPAPRRLRRSTTGARCSRVSPASR